MFINNGILYVVGFNNSRADCKYISHDYFGMYYISVYYRRSEHNVLQKQWRYDYITKLCIVT